MIREINYRGWPDCFRLENEIVALTINASAGGRVMTFERNGINIIFEDPGQDGKLLKDYLSDSFDPDGGRFDFGPEKITDKIHDITFFGPYKTRIIDDLCIEITSLPDKNLGVITKRKFRLESKTEKLTVTQTMKNISKNILEYFFWGRTLVKTEGIFFMPVNPGSNFTAKWGRYIWGEPDQFASDPADMGVAIKNGLFVLSTHKASNEKYGVDSKDGWMAYAYKGLLFLKRNKYFEDMPYGENFGLTNIFYLKKGVFGEMEPVSPVSKLRPEEEFTYTEFWHLIHYTSATNKDFDISEAEMYLKEKYLPRPL